MHGGVRHVPRAPPIVAPRWGGRGCLLGTVCASALPHALGGGGVGLEWGLSAGKVVV